MASNSANLSVSLLLNWPLFCCFAWRAIISVSVFLPEILNVPCCFLTLLSSANAIWTWCGFLVSCICFTKPVIDSSVCDFFLLASLALNWFTILCVFAVFGAPTSPAVAGAPYLRSHFALLFLSLLVAFCPVIFLAAVPIHLVGVPRKRFVAPTFADTPAKVGLIALNLPHPPPYLLFLLLLLLFL